MIRKLLTEKKGKKPMYNPKSLKAEEFISDEEIRETLAYADANKENVELIDQILAKAKECKGLTHREASVLLACPIPEKIQEMYDLAADFFIPRRIMIKNTMSATPSAVRIIPENRIIWVTLKKE